ncbi:MAG TPA: COX15/CtaA family protein [Candidatus Baltobacteraceae bacterium]|nr:COX15/CtaA family protein [Candidatus Baltobacteraceae bacterium]
MKTLRRLSAASVVVALGTVLLGSWTRINGAGMTCPDWPLCHGMLIPSMGGGTIWEWMHRLFAFSVAPLVLAVMIAAWRVRDRARYVTPTLGVIGALFVVQCLLGAATVHLANSPISVVSHWATAMAFIAALCAMMLFAGNPDDAQPPASASHAEIALVGILAGTTLVTFVTMCIGAYVSSSGDGLACLSIPGCAGTIVVYTQGQYVQMLHRAIAAATLLCAVSSFAFAWMRPVSVRVRIAVTTGLGLVFVQIVLGLLNVVLRLPMDLREAHAFNAALLFLAFVIATLLAALDARELRLESSRTPT